MKKDEVLSKLASGEITQEEASRLLVEATETRRGLYCKVSPKGAISVYGLQRMPVTLYVEQWSGPPHFRGRDPHLYVGTPCGTERKWHLGRFPRARVSRGLNRVFGAVSIKSRVLSETRNCKSPREPLPARSGGPDTGCRGERSAGGTYGRNSLRRVGSVQNRKLNTEWKRD